MTKVRAINMLAAVEVTFTPSEANVLYNEILYLLRQRDVVSPADRHLFDAPGLYTLYDALNEAGIDGSGP